MASHPDISNSDYEKLIPQAKLETMSMEINQLDDETMISENGDSTSSLPEASHLDKIIRSLEVLITMQEQRSDDLRDSFGSLQNRLDQIEYAVSELSTVQQDSNAQQSGNDARNADPETDSELDEEKQSILAEYGLLIDDQNEKENDKQNDDENGENDKEDSNDEADSESEELELNAQSDSNMDSDEVSDKDCETANNITDEKPGDKSEFESRMPKEDADEIELLKQKLRDQVREAEVKLSIQRTKLEQREARIEEKLAALERTEYRDSICDSGAPEATGMLGRLKKHLQVFSRAKAGESHVNEKLAEELAEHLVDELKDELIAEEMISEASKTDSNETEDKE